MTTVRHVATPWLDVAYEEHGPPDGPATILLHGFPYDPRCHDAVAPALAARGHRVIVPYLRGYGPTRFRSPDTPRSGQQAALAADLRELMDALRIDRAALMGFDWGGRAACIVAALWPERVRALVTGDGYNVHDVAGFARPLPPEQEYPLWYQYYFHTPRGVAGLTANRAAISRLLWRLWSPSWAFDDATHARTAASFDNPDFVDVVIHSYRCRYGYVAGDPTYDDIERAVAPQPPIAVPTISLCGADSGFGPPAAIDPHAARFTGPYQRRILPRTGHNIPQEAPDATVAALLDLAGR